MIPEGLWIVTAGLGAILLYHFWFGRGKPPEEVDAFRHPDGASDEQLLRTCQACQQLIELDPKDRAALAAWGRALHYLAWRSTSRIEQARLYAEAEQKYEAALALDPHNKTYAIGLVPVLVARATLNRGSIAHQLANRACQLCDDLVSTNPRNEFALRNWACALHCLAQSVADSEADSILAQAEEKCRAALAIQPTNGWTISLLGLIVLRRAKLRDGDERRELILRASEVIESGLRVPNGDQWSLLSTWAYVLFTRNRYMPGEQTNRLLEQADCMFQAALDAGADRAKIIAGWGVVHWARGLLQKAKEELIEDAARGPGPSPYNVACICARLGQIDECRKWLEQSGEPGHCVSRNEMATERELENVRDCDWFRAILEAQKS